MTTPRPIASNADGAALPDEAVLKRFDVRGDQRLRAAMAGGRGAILVGSHLGAHVAGLHWLHRRGLPVRLLVQRPKHVSRALQVRFDRGGPHLLVKQEGEQ